MEEVISSYVYTHLSVLILTSPVKPKVFTDKKQRLGGVWLAFHLLP